jgi:hypothetical protein
MGFKHLLTPDLRLPPAFGSYTWHVVCSTQGPGSMYSPHAITR